MVSWKLFWYIHIKITCKCNSISQNCWDTVLSPSQCWCTQLCELTAINNIARERRKRCPGTYSFPLPDFLGKYSFLFTWGISKKNLKKKVNRNSFVPLIWFWDLPFLEHSDNSNCNLFCSPVSIRNLTRFIKPSDRLN